MEMKVSSTTGRTEGNDLSAIQSESESTSGVVVANVLGKSSTSAALLRLLEI